MTVECPRPNKASYITKQDARNAARLVHDRILETLRPYRCPCKRWHLTKKHTPAQTAATTGTLHELTDTDFRQLVTDDASGQVRSSALRHPDNLIRWQRHLGWLIHEVDQQLAASRKNRSAWVAEWRPRAVAYRAALSNRLLECRSLRVPGANSEAAR